MFEDGFKYSLLSIFKTNHLFLDTIISTVLLSIIGYFMNTQSQLSSNRPILWRDAIKSWFYKKHSLTIEGKRTTCYTVYDRNPVISLIFSNRFKAIWHYLLETMETNPSIHEIKEICNMATTPSGSNQEQRTETGNTTTIDDQDLLIVSQKTSFLLDKALQIYAVTQFTQDEDAEQKEKRGTASSSIKTERMTIVLYSYLTDINGIKRYISNITDQYLRKIEDARKEKQYIYTLSSTKFTEDIQECWSEHLFGSTRTFENMFFDEKPAILDKIRFFLDNRQWYYDMGIPYTLGIGLHGPPGTGKTSFIKALANMTGRHIVILSLQLIKTRKQLHDFWYETRYHSSNKKGKIDFSKKIIVIEDIDCAGDIVMKRKTHPLVEQKADTDPATVYTRNILDKLDTLCKQDEGIDKLRITIPAVEEDPIHLDDLLNMIDGIKETPGRILVISSNHYEKLDDALTRPGRIDVTMKMDHASRETIAEMYRHYYREDLSSEIVAKIQDRVFSPAEIINQYILHKEDRKKFIRHIVSKPEN